MANYETNNIVKLTSRTPTDIVTAANSLLPKHLRGLIVYNSELKCLESKNIKKADAYYDPFHGVLEVKY